MIGKIVVLLLLAFILYRLTRSYKPRIIYNESGELKDIVPKIGAFKLSYKPTPWLVGGNIHTIWGMRFRKSSRMKPRREELYFEDGGNTILDWFEPNEAAEDTPIVVIVHTLAGGTREPCTNNFAEACVKNGWRAVVANSRGCSGAKFTSKRFYNAIEIDDLQSIIKRVRDEFKPKFVFMAGFSLGGLMTCTYVVQDGSVDAAAIVSHVYDGIESAKILENPIESKLYLSVIMQKLTHAVKKNPYCENPEAIAAKTLRKFDDVFTSRNLGLKDHIEYYSKTLIYDKVPNFKAPLLILASDDDPFTRRKFMPIKEVQESSKCVMVEVPEGGHVSFLTGIDARRSYTETILPAWFKSIAESKQ